MDARSGLGLQWPRRLTNRFLSFFKTNGVSEHCSPRMIVYKENLDYEQHCRYAIGDYVLTPN